MLAKQSQQPLQHSARPWSISTSICGRRRREERTETYETAKQPDEAFLHGKKVSLCLAVCIGWTMGQKRRWRITTPATSRAPRRRRSPCLPRPRAADAPARTLHVCVSPIPTASLHLQKWWCRYGRTAQEGRRVRLTHLDRLRLLGHGFASMRSPSCPRLCVSWGGGSDGVGIHSLDLLFEDCSECGCDEKHGSDKTRGFWK